MTQAIKQFLEADAKRTQGELVVTGMGNGHSMIMDTTSDTGDRYVGETFHSEDANFIAAASRIAPEIRELLVALEQVCEALENIRLATQHDRGNYAIYVISKEALAAAAPYRKGNV